MKTNLMQTHQGDLSLEYLYELKISFNAYDEKFTYYSGGENSTIKVLDQNNKPKNFKYDFGEDQEHLTLIMIDPDFKVFVNDKLVADNTVLPHKYIPKPIEQRIDY